MALTNIIRLLRCEHGGLTQEDLAKLIGVSRQTVNAIEGNKYSPSLEVAFKIADVFGCGIHDIFEYELQDSDSHDPFS